MVIRPENDRQVWLLSAQRLCRNWVLPQSDAAEVLSSQKQRVEGWCFSEPSNDVRLWNLERQMIHPDFDRSAFLDPTTGDFRFPKNASAPGSLVRVRDRTKYSSEQWTSAGYTAEEKRHCSIKCYEEEALPEIEVDGFKVLFQPKSKKFLGALGFLSGGYQLVTGIGFALDPLGENAPFLGDGSLNKLLIKKKVLIPVHDRSEYLLFFARPISSPLPRQPASRLT